MKKQLFLLILLASSILLTNAQPNAVEKSVSFYDGSANAGAWHSWSGSPLLTLTDGMIPTSTDFHLPNAEASLNLAWTATGTWSIKVAANADWENVDIAECDHLVFQLYSPIDLAASSLPAIGLNGNDSQWTNSKRLSVWLTQDLSAGEWTELVIPLSDFAWSPAPFTGISTMSVEDWGELPSTSLYIGSITFQHRTATAADDAPRISPSPLRLSVDGGVLNARFEGMRRVQLFTADGRTIEQSEVADAYSRTLTKGLYLIKVGEEVRKVLIP